MAVEIEPSRHIQLYLAAMRQMTAEGQCDKMASDMEVRMKRRCVTEFLHAEKIAPNDIHRRLRRPNSRC